MYKFSVPMPYSKQNINKLVDINNNIKKSKITSVYFALPNACNLYTGFELSRFEHEQTNFDYWKNLISYSIEKGFDFIYLLNSNDSVYYENLNKQLEILDILLNELSNIGVDKLRVTNPQLISYLNKKYKSFKLYSSVSCEYKTIHEYENFIKYYPYIKQIVPSPDNNKNFKLLKNLTSRVELEIMVNEGCIIGCSHRNFHYRIGDFNKEIKEIIFRPDFYNKKCNILNKQNEYIVNSNCIYPWQIKEYSKIGINNFKLVGRDMKDFATGKYLEYYERYLKGIDDYKNIEETPISYFTNYIINKNELPYKVKDIKAYLPKISHFKKYGHLCASHCGVECRYCYKCASKIQKVFIKKQEENRKKTIPVCIIK